MVVNTFNQSYSTRHTKLTTLNGCVSISYIKLTFSNTQCTLRSSHSTTKLESILFPKQLPRTRMASSYVCRQTQLCVEVGTNPIGSGTNPTEPGTSPITKSIGSGTKSTDPGTTYLGTSPIGSGTKSTYPRTNLRCFLRPGADHHS